MISKVCVACIRKTMACKYFIEFNIVHVDYYWLFTAYSHGIRIMFTIIDRIGPLYTKGTINRIII